MNEHAITLNTRVT